MEYARSRPTSYADALGLDPSDWTTIRTYDVLLETQIRIRWTNAGTVLESDGLFKCEEVTTFIEESSTRDKFQRYTDQSRTNQMLLRLRKERDRLQALADEHSALAAEANRLAAEYSALGANFAAAAVPYQVLAIICFYISGPTNPICWLWQAEAFTLGAMSAAYYVQSGQQWQINARETITAGMFAGQAQAIRDQISDGNWPDEIRTLTIGQPFFKPWSPWAPTGQFREVRRPVSPTRCWCKQLIGDEEEE